MAKGLKELKRNQSLQYNKLNELVNDVLLYGKYNEENTEKVVLTMNSLQNRNSSSEGLLVGIKNGYPLHYLHAEIGDYIFSYGIPTSYLHKCSERHNGLYESYSTALKCLKRN